MMFMEGDGNEEMLKGDYVAHECFAYPRVTVVQLDVLLLVDELLAQLQPGVTPLKPIHH
jgi:hypothetical protein